jgi:DEAD/DEAH box helicase domain-containing protein
LAKSAVQVALQNSSAPPVAPTAQSLALRSRSTIEAVRDVLSEFSSRDRTGEILTAVKHFPAREGQFADMPEWMNPAITAAYRAKGIDRLYTHQAAATEAIHAGRSVVIVTPTASGKTVCYNLPVLNAVIENRDTRALYLYPTKALAQDQLAELHDLGMRLNDAFGVFTYDGDTPTDARRSIRERGHIVLSNPDMLHAGILPHHTKWIRLFENLRYIVLDELHTYRGVLGSHLTNVLRRLRRIAKFYGSDPQFICSSATIANPGELASRLIESDVQVLDENGAPAAEKIFVFYNPPVINRNLGIRRSYLNESTRVAKELLANRLQTIVFANSRLHTELMLTYLQQANPTPAGQEPAIRGYRGGYLPGERRAIERGLREGKIRGVVTTNALELGIDIGSLDAAVMAGYPGSVASTWQRAGRAGRRAGAACAIYVASSAPLDQFMVQHPDYFFGRSPEHAYIQPDNLEILVNHLKCAAFELPIAPGEKFGEMDLQEICARLAAAGYLHLSGGNWHWIQDSYPADTVSLRSVTSDNFVIIDITGDLTGNEPSNGYPGDPEVIGETDFTSGLTTLHPKAIYFHQGQQYHVERLDFAERKAYVKRVNVDYFTTAIRYTQVRVLEIAGSESVAGPAEANHGDVLVRSQVVGFKKVKLFTNENVGSGNLELPENEMHTTAFWFTLDRPLMSSLQYALSDRQAGLFGLLRALESMACLLLMCDARDLGTAIGERPPSPGIQPDWQAPADVAHSANEAPDYFEPNLYLYDAYPGGIGFSEPLFEMQAELLRKTQELISSCPCENGCPSCMGPADQSQFAKEVALKILQRMCGRAQR